MRVLLVYCHPREDSFCAALRDAALGALRAGGHEVELRDLYAEGFDPVLSAEERGVYHDLERNTAGIEAEVAQLRRAEALLLVYPTWWYGMPAMLKGWFDRVWVPGVTFTLGAGAIEPRLTNIRRLGVVTTYGSPWWLLAWLGWPDRRVIAGGVRRLMAKGCPVDWLSLNRMDHRGQAERERFLAKVARRLSAW
ncbi:MAG: NAD(P)H-dependent oxidoreductase [Roseococcus sp.]|nr:NAD(P)H-dependent oxidoreductase [Roseococcus sp.]